MNGRPVAQKAALYGLLRLVLLIGGFVVYLKWQRLWHQLLGNGAPIYFFMGAFVVNLPGWFLFGCPRCGTSAFKFGKASLKLWGAFPNSTCARCGLDLTKPWDGAPRAD